MSVIPVSQLPCCGTATINDCADAALTIITLAITLKNAHIENLPCSGSCARRNETMLHAYGGALQ